VKTVAILVLAALVVACNPAPEFDIVIRGGDVYDGNPIPPQRADVGIKGDRVTAIGNLADRRTALVIDASGYAVAPGFINANSQSGTTLLADGNAESSVRQGITTEVLLDGGPASWNASNPPPPADLALLNRFGIAVDWSSAEEYRARLEERGTSVNVVAGVSLPVAPIDPAAPAGQQIDAVVARAAGNRPAEALLPIDLESAEPAALGDVAGPLSRAAGVYLMPIVSGYTGGAEQHEQPLRGILGWSGTMIGTNAAAVRAEGALAEGARPGAFGAFPRVLGRLVREHWLDLRNAVFRATGLPATHLPLPDRGHVRPGYFADIVVFDPAQLDDRSTSSAPRRYPSGIVYVLVNGVPTVVPSGHTGARAGRALAAPPVVPGG
jgi:N-acyl-D-aspartate/D-glutamate deacylase